MYACLCAHAQGARGRTLSYEFIIVGGVARESYGTRETSIRSSLHIYMMNLHHINNKYLTVVTVQI